MCFVVLCNGLYFFLFSDALVVKYLVLVGVEGREKHSATHSLQEKHII